MTARILELDRSPAARYDAGQPSPYHNPPPASQSPDAELSAAGTTLRNWARDLADNSAIVAAILSSRVTNAIGAGLKYEPLVRDRKGNLLPEVNARLRRIHDDWSKSVDVTGELSRQEAERLMWRGWDIDGESFARAVRRPFGTAINFRLQLIDADLVPYWMTQEFREQYIVNGIQKDAWGRPIRYYVAPRQQDIVLRGQGFASDPGKMDWVSARDMWHFKRTSRCNQTRGISLLTQIIFRVADISRYQEAHRLAARASADLFASVNRASDMEDASLYESTDEGGSKSPKRRGFELEHMTMLDGLLPGESVNFHAPQHPNQDAVEFVKQEQRQIAAATDVGFSQIAQVFDSSYAAQRLEVVDTYRKAERDRAKFISDFARDALYEQPVEAALNAGMIPQSVLRRADRETLLDARIDGPQMPVIDPVKDRAAYEKDQDKGWDSRWGIIRRMGKSPAEVDAERAGDAFNDEGEPVPANSGESPQPDPEED